MSTLREAAQRALEAFEEIADEVFSPYDNKLGDAILALRAALAQQDESVEPVARYQKRGQEVLTFHPACWGREDEPWKPLYTAPPQRKPLTEEEIGRIGMKHVTLREVIRAVERAHGIKE